MNESYAMCRRRHKNIIIKDTDDKLSCFDEGEFTGNVLCENLTSGQW